MFRSLVLTAFCAVLVSVSASAQLGKIPVAVTAAFSKQYTEAKEVAFSDNLGDYSVAFKVDTAQMTAHYNKKGEWKGSEKTIAFDQLSTEVKDGFMKSKFSDWQVSGVRQLYLTPGEGGGEQYRIKVSQGNLKKRYLYFNKVGKLVRDKMTL
ncbi:hypothetical protein EPD60_10950 [Flaviaesturariibacter flavus]|uniref:Uncharacterized protein n=1 Tax=Flaviaesturariibacter flavus TaxID=2502780 RepID=A0A4R1BBZ9_9BACT|nr:PepSY-like domain-containing protein [Flaviaesturariibacter flavus]TCJ14497.1 hypothetical protein EPD60_10950 [Flaviaesturariibacter flavus]